MGRRLRIGLFSPYFGFTVGGGEKYLAVAAEALRDAYPEHAIEIVSPVPVDAGRYRALLNVNLDGIGLRATNPRVTPVHRLANRLRPLRPLRNLVVSAQAGRATADYDLLLGMVYAIPVRSRARRSVMLCQFPYPDPDPRDIEPYELIIAQSRYTRGWVQEYWNREAAVVNPPIDLPAGPPEWAAKRNLILGVGRFFATGHTKRQDLLVESFRRLCDRGLEGWELHLAGAVHRDAAHAGYYERVSARAAGYPVVLHPDAGYQEVQDLYRSAAIFWHAAGYGVDPRADPGALEHFGMTTAEAMAAGAVPLAYGVGGQAEVLADNVEGHLWSTPADLEARTIELVGDPAMRRRMGEAAAAGSRRFGRDEFRRKMLELPHPIVQELSDTPR